MNKFLTGLLLGIIVGAVGFWYLQKKANEHPEAQQRYEASAAQLRTNAVDMAHNISDAVHAKLDTLDLHGNQITNELATTGKVFRSKAHEVGVKVADAASDVRAISAIKAKYLADTTLSAWDISVGCSQGHVTLSGTVSSPDDIGRAVAIAFDTDGVEDVTSTLVVKPKE
ncbi:MAG TPA: BON domain-containing protein [Verrucomicrobiae bacterium]|jgi:osmotically-inducible protein OsmY